MALLRKLKLEVSSIQISYALTGAAVCLAAGIISLLISGPAKLDTEPVLPDGLLPGYVYNIIWTFMYLLIGAAAGTVLSSRGRRNEVDRNKGILLFIIMMIFNVLWYPLFFCAESIYVALLDALIIDVLSFFTMLYFIRVSIISGFAVFPYLLWILWLTYQNTLILVLNG